MQGQKPKEVVITTADGLDLYANLYEIDKKNSIIIMFHQGGSNSRVEYVSIIPELSAIGYNILAVDQRLGGQVYGDYNKTVANIPDNGYGDAYPDLEASLQYVIRNGFVGKIFLWRSSCSASLAIKTGAHHQE